MTTKQTLKDEARRHEQRDEWHKALSVYLKVIEMQAGGEDPDIALHNRVGDLRIRIGDVEGAIESYEAAIQLYLDAELPNNAIAMCRKIVRHAPDRASPYIRMGRIRAAQGFVVDARENFLMYAELQEGLGNTDEAFRSLAEFVGLAPEDVETRLFLAEQLLTLDQRETALGHLGEAYRILTARGEESRAVGVLERIRELEPDLPPSGIVSDTAESEPVDHANEGLADFEATSLAGDLESMGDESALESRGDEGAEAEEPGPDLDFEDIMLDAEEEPESLASDDDVPEEPFELPILQLDGKGGWEDEDDEDDEDNEDDWESEGGAIRVDVEGSGLDEVPMDEFGAEDISLEKLRHRVDEDPRDAEGWRLLGELLMAQGEIEEGWEALDRAHPVYADAGKPGEAMAVVREMLRVRPHRIELRQRVVEYAYRTNDREWLVAAFLELAGGLLELGQPTKAEAVYRQVLALDAENEEARRGLDDGAASPTIPVGTDGGGTSTPSTSEAERDDYVDLGALVLDEDREVSTRWVVAAEKPSGDDAADFARMLAQFKEKVAQNLDSDDATAHYDLGVAYLEMGLLEEAIGEFQDALRAAPQNLGTYEMLGQCFLDQGEPEAAIHSLSRGLELGTQVEDDLLGIYYFLARAHEVLGHTDSAKELYGKVFSLDINFKDVTERLRALR